MATPTLKYVAPTTPEDELTFAPEPVVIYGVPSGGGGGSTAWNDITGKPSAFPPSAHTQAISTITGLQTTLDGKASTADLDNTFGIATEAHDNADSALALATTAVQPAALSAYVPTSRTVAGKPLSADVTLAKGDVGLGNVDNTSDANKPVSTAQSTAIAAKVNTADVAGLNTVGWNRAVYIPKNGTVPGGTPVYTTVIELEA